jgi:hypothetical protein
MYAELVVHTERNLPRELASVLAEQWGPGVEPSTAVALSTLADERGWMHLLRYAQITSNAVYLVFTPDPRTLRLYIESTALSSDLKHLRLLVEAETRKVRTLLERQGNAGKRFEVQIFAEDTYLQTGSLRSWRERFAGEMREHVVTKLYVPLSTFLLSLPLQYEVRQAMFNAGAAIFALLVWVMGTATFQESGYHYQYRE